MTTWRRSSWALIAPLILVPFLSAPAQEANPNAQLERKFLQGLRDRGYFDLAQEDIDRLRQAADTPAEIKAVLDIEQGRDLLEEAVTRADLERRRACSNRPAPGSTSSSSVRPIRRQPPRRSPPWPACNSSAVRPPPSRPPRPTPPT